MKMWIKPLAACFSAVMLMGNALAADVSAGYPTSYVEMIEAAEKEGRIVIYANTEQFAVNPILEDFQKAFPKIEVDYVEVKSADLYSRVSSEAAADALKADFVWSSAMDLQFRMLEEGIAATYETVEKASLPDWASWQNQIYGVTFEPVVFIYNKKLISEADMPKNRADLAKMLTTRAAEFKGKITSYDPQRSGLGFFVLSHDFRIDPNLWTLAKAFGAADAKFYTATGTMLEKVSSGEHAIAYNIIGPYAMLKAEKDPNIGVVIPEDYTQILTRVAFVTKAAKHPNAARVFLDYLLSKRGQTIIADKALLFSIRQDVQGRATAAELIEKHGATLKPIKIDPTLTEELDPIKRVAFFRKWDAALASGK